MPKKTLSELWGFSKSKGSESAPKLPEMHDISDGEKLGLVDIAKGLGLINLKPNDKNIGVKITERENNLSKMNIEQLFDEATKNNCTILISLLNNRQVSKLWNPLKNHIFKLKNDQTVYPNFIKLCDEIANGNTKAVNIKELKERLF